MAILECPLCCAENFPDEYSLQDHLFNLSDNIVCPVCEVQFKTIRTLAIHLGGECRQLLTEAQKDDNGSKSEEKSNNECSNKKEQLNKTLDTVVGKTDQSQEQTFSIPNCDKEVQDVTQSHPLELDKNNEKCDNQGVCIEIDAQENAIDVQSSLITFLNESGIPNECVPVEDKLYSCSVCNITFASIEDHLRDYHQDEYVLVDNNVPELGNWTAEDPLQSHHNSKVFTSKHGCVLVPPLERSEHGRWISTAEGYFYAANDKKAQELQLRMSHKKSDLESAVRTITEGESGSAELSNYCGGLWADDWPEDVRTLRLATFLSIDSDLINVDGEGNEPSCTIEKKPYAYRDHKVRVVRLRGGSSRQPSLENIPFPEKPPDDLFPVLEPAINAPDDLMGTLGVMWPCQNCGHSELHWSSLAEHNCVLPSVKKKTPTHRCSICSTNFLTKRILISHFNAVHRGSRQAPSMILQCEICSAKVQTSSRLEKHMAMHKKYDLTKCEECKSMVQKSTFEEHVKAHGKNGKLSLVCSLCNRPFKGETELKLHIPQCHLQDQESSNLQCIVCQEVYTEVSTLREHLVTHNIPIRSHCCQYCPKSFNRLIDKVIHERVHTKSKPHECKECGRCFRLKNSLMTHLRIHTGERPFTCSSCDKAFRTKHLLRIHSASHITSSQFKCTYCPKVFKCKERARVHENLHKNSHTCQECGRTFHSLSFMKRHTDYHKKGSLVYKCNMCPNMFTRASCLESHLVNDHGLDPAASMKISCKKTFEHMEANLDVPSDTV